MTTRRLRARLERLGVPPETTPMSSEDDTAGARLLELLLKPWKNVPLSPAEELELAMLKARFPPDPHDPLADAIAAWRANAHRRS
jgi:hypothetical protein